MNSKSPDLPPVLTSRKTRDLPNISDCQSCNRRINNTNPKNRIRILTSEWRIVLLCKNCHNLVESSQFCSYCLAMVSNDSYFDCKKCCRRIHKECVAMYSNFGNDSVCLDCWMPNLLENEYKRDRIKRIGTCSKKRIVEKVSNGDMPLLPKTRACKLKENEKGKKLESLVKNSNVFVERKIVCAMEAKRKAVAKVMEAKKAVEIASGALEVVAVEKGGVISGDRGGSVVDEDAQLAIKVHRSMTRSTSMSRYSCLLNTHCEDVPDLDGGVGGFELRGGNETSCLSKVANGKGSLTGRELNGFCSSVFKQECEVSYDMTQNGERDGCMITYVRKRHASVDVKCKEDLEDRELPEFPLKVYCKKMSQVKKRNVDANRCSQVEKHNVDANRCFPVEIHIVDVNRCSLVEKLDVGASYCSQVEKNNVDANHCSLVENHNVDASYCSRTYIRRKSRCKSSLSNGSLNLDNGNLAPATSHSLDDAS